MGHPMGGTMPSFSPPRPNLQRPLSAWVSARAQVCWQNSKTTTNSSNLVFSIWESFSSFLPRITIWANLKPSEEFITIITIDQVLVLMKGGHIRFRRPYSLPSIYSHIEASNSEADSPARPGPLAAKKPVQTKTFQIIQNPVFYSQCHFCTTISAPLVL